MSLSRRRSLVLLLSGFVVPAAGMSCIRDTTDFTADEIVARHVEALGGPEALKAVETMKISGSWVFVGDAISMTIVRKRPDAFHFQISDASDRPKSGNSFSIETTNNVAHVLLEVFSIDRLEMFW